MKLVKGGPLLVSHSVRASNQGFAMAHVFVLATASHLRSPNATLALVNPEPSAQHGKAPYPTDTVSRCLRCSTTRKVGEEQAGVGYAEALLSSATSANNRVSGLFQG